MSKPVLIRIKASAGAGKTYQLSLRFLELLKEFSPPHPKRLRSIVAITFTNKAAAEMKERILRFLKEIALDTPFGTALSAKTGLSPEEASAWLETIIYNYSDFQVRTIDSLLFTILKGLSFELNLRPDSKVSFSIDRPFEEAFSSLLARINEDLRQLWEEILETYLAIDGRGGFYPEAGLKWRLKGLLPKISDNIKKKKLDKKIIKEAESSVREAYREFFVHYCELKPYFKKNIFRLSENIDPLSLYAKKFLNKDVEELFKKGALNKVPSEKLKAFKDAFKELKKRLEDLKEAYAQRAFVCVSGYVPMLRRLRNEIEDICRRQGIIFSEHWTRLVLQEIRKEGTLPLVYSHLGASVSHFLFDEFQDTSVPQWEALFPLFENALSEGGSLFVVGDVKQAIYRWRGGDWSLFKNLFKLFPQIEIPEDRVIGENYRSHICLVSFINTLFVPLTDKRVVSEKIAPLVLGEHPLQDVYFGFAKSISQSFAEYIQTPTEVRGHKGCIFKIYIKEAPKEELRQSVKRKLIEEIGKEWERRKSIKDKVPIAVLLRSNKEAEEVACWLLEAGFPVVTENVLRLGASSVVKGLISFLSYLYEPQNTLALYGFLASGLLPHGPKDEKELFNGWILGDWLRWEAKARDIAGKLRPFANRRAPYELLYALLEELDIFSRLKTDLASHKVFVERLLEVSHQFELEEGPSLSKYLAFWEEGGLEERVGLPENISAIRVLTIHKAKGLEFPVVFIPFTDWYVRDRTPIDVHEGYLVHLKKIETDEYKIPLPDELERRRLSIIAAEAQELLNLFYVAVTRAKEALYLYLTLPKKGNLKPLSVWVKTLFEESSLSCLVQPLE